MSTYKIPFNKPCLQGEENAYLDEVMKSATWSGDGHFTKRCHELLESELQVKKALLTTSCTHALELSAMLLDIGPGDEVIMPSFTFVSTANAFVVRGATPIFVDVRPDTLNIDDSLVAKAITPKTKAIVVVHYAGVGCEMDALLEISRQENIPIIEDNAHGLFGAYRDKPLGSLGCLATLSFHETKNFTCGEGGALLINDEQYIQRAEILREKGTNRSRFFRGEVDKYSWVDIGSSYLPSDLLAAFLYAQLKSHERIQEKRKSICQTYTRELSGWAQQHGVQMPAIPDHCASAWHMFYLIFPTEEVRARVIAFLKDRGILSVFHYLPLHLSTMGLTFGGKAGDCPITESVSETLLRLPLYYDMTHENIETVCQALKEAFS